MDSLVVQYWFQGPLDGVPMFADLAPADYFRVQCEWATTGGLVGCWGRLA